MPETLRTCPRCRFEFFSSHATYCSVACKQWAYRRRVEDFKLQTVTRPLSLLGCELEDIDMSRMIDADDVAAKLKCSRSYVGTLVTTDQSFPKPRRLGRLIRWPEADIDRWIAGGRAETVQSRPAEAYQQRVV